MVQTRSGQASTASESKPRTTNSKATKAKKDFADDMKKKDVKKPVDEGKAETPPETVPEKRKRHDEPENDVAQEQEQEPSSKEEQPPPTKTVKENEETTDIKH